MVEDSGAVLGTGFWALTVRGCGVMHSVEEFEELAVGYLGWVVGYLEGFCVCSQYYQYLYQNAIGRGKNIRPVLPEHTLR